MTYNYFYYPSPLLPVQTSLWPVLLSLSLFSLLSSFVLFLNLKVSFFYTIMVALLPLVISLLWWNDVSAESVLGYHTHKLELSLRVGILFFILSEVFFFFSFFWAFYDSSLSPTVDLGLCWPPNGISPLSCYSIPLLNTVLLLVSGVTVTWAHHALINNLISKSFISLLFTLTLGFCFLFIQYLEYYETSFSMSDGIYGSTFFMSTGFHGFHVIVGVSFLTYVLKLLLQGKLLYNHHFSFEAAAWYWHFVDVVWLILFISIYWWGSL